MSLGSVPFDRSIKRRKSTQYRFDIGPKEYEAFMAGIRNGLSIEDASWNANLTPRRVFDWLKKGEILADEELPVGCSAWQYSRFWHDFKKASSNFVGIHVANINAASVKSTPHNWTASAWMLERKRPEQFSQKYILEKISDQKILDFIKLIFDTVDDNAREQVAAVIQMLPSLKLHDVA
jgi:hypothetical protein